jgi:hypothetical protein
MGLSYVTCSAVKPGKLVLMAAINLPTASHMLEACGALNKLPLFRIYMREG